MRKDRKIQVLSIVALVLAITGMSLGFAAFSATLNISSSATVTPNSDDFKINVYGLKESRSLTDIMNSFDESWLSDTVGMAYAYNSTNTTFTQAKINNNKNSVSISNIQAQYISDTNCNVEYYFLIANEGQYDAILPYAPFESYFENTYTKNCNAEENTNSELVNAVCEGMDLYIALGNAETSEEILNSATNVTVDFTSGYTLKPGEKLFMCVGIDYESSVLPDGNMTIEFGDINFSFTTAPISN